MQSEDMNSNAKYIYNYFRARGWTAQAICGMLGNMQGDSGIIADIEEREGGGGYGLVQWTPKLKLVNWANARELNYRSVDTQCQRIQWELENGLQFIRTNAYPLTFKQYIASTESAAYTGNARPLMQGESRRNIKDFVHVRSGRLRHPSSGIGRKRLKITP